MAFGCCGQSRTIPASRPTQQKVQFSQDTLPRICTLSEFPFSARRALCSTLSGVACQTSSRCRRQRLQRRRTTLAEPETAIREIDPESRGDGGVSDKTGWEGLGQQFWNSGWACGPCSEPGGQPQRGKWCAGYLKGCKVASCWELKRKFRFMKPALDSCVQRRRWLNELLSRGDTRC